SDIPGGDSIPGVEQQPLSVDPLPGFTLADRLRGRQMVMKVVGVEERKDGHSGWTRGVLEREMDGVRHAVHRALFDRNDLVHLRYQGVTLLADLRRHEVHATTDRADEALPDARLLPLRQSASTDQREALVGRIVAETQVIF